MEHYTDSIGKQVEPPHPFTPLVRRYIAADISSFLCAHSLLPFVFPYISLPRRQFHMPILTFPLYIRIESGLVGYSYHSMKTL
jgi:hypothetical protein